MALTPLISETLRTLRVAMELLAYSTALFRFIVLIVKGREAIAAGRRAMSEVRLNLWWYFLDAMFVGPVVALAVAAIDAVVKTESVAMLSPQSCECVWPAVSSYA